MAERLDAVVAREYTTRDGAKKTAWTKIGSAFPAKNGGYLLVLDALPLPGPDGACKVNLMVPRPRDGDQRGGGRQEQRDTGNGGEGYGQEGGGDDDIPW